MSFSDKVVIVTGAAKGIGRGVALAYGEKGAKIIIADIDDRLGHETVKHLRDRQITAQFIQTDVRSEAAIQHLMEETTKAFGTIDILVNNAGKGAFKPMAQLTVDEWEDVIHTNLRSVFLCSREAAKVMRENPQGGAIVNIASTRALMSEPHSEPYAATKGGIVALTHALAASLSEEHITVNAISPGWIETGDYSTLRAEDHVQHFSKRVGKPEDIAKACLYLTQEDNDFVTGINLVVDGGMTRKMIYEE
ncbi:putative oxidoreductase [Pullulanibacillus camelliae]|uniref:Putative oxidoreductase n=1 Tax=Pullulanibacillus camelliae TaxID=1707096 RepID=A0A8J2VLR1_9BACL|nr:glucose 1-dehydrogenase [Pullulanibacillus camelliae]GGE36854.1 putative oxidoreductase [Pullulanibacillus camelliae]